jgi:hypothetical protein
MQDERQRDKTRSAFRQDCSMTFTDLSQIGFLDLSMSCVLYLMLSIHNEFRRRNDVFPIFLVIGHLGHFGHGRDRG